MKKPDKTKYEIYDALRATVPKCRNWNELKKELQKQGITTSFKNKGNSDEVQGVMFEKNGYKFNGSKIDRQFSYIKIDFQLSRNDKVQNSQIHQEHKHFQNQSSVLENVGTVLSGLFDFQPQGTDYDPDEAELLKQHSLKKKKKRGRSL